MATTADARAILRQSVTDAPQIAAYEAARGLPPGTLAGVMLFHPHCPYMGVSHAALVAAVTVPTTGELRACQRTAIEADGTAKARDLARADQKKSLGPTSGAAVVFGSFDGARSVLEGEGIETVASARAALDRPAIATLSAGTLGKPPLPPGLAVVILADRGSEDDARKGAARRKAERRRVWIAVPPEGCKDFNDLLRECGIEAVRECLIAARPFTDPVPPPAPKLEPRREWCVEESPSAYRAQALEDMHEATLALADASDDRRQMLWSRACAVGKYVHHGIVSEHEFRSLFVAAADGNGSLAKYGALWVQGELTRALQKSRADKLPPLARRFREVAA